MLSIIPSLSHREQILNCNQAGTGSIVSEARRFEALEAVRRAWAPHIRLHEDTGAPGRSKPGAISELPAPVDSQGAAAAKEADDETSSAFSGMPTSVTLPARVNASVMKSQLQDLGYANISAIEKSGSIFHLRADWQGQPLKLRIDSRDGEIKVMGR